MPTRGLLPKLGGPPPAPGGDDAEGNLLIREGDVLASPRTGFAYTVTHHVGSGSFGTVVKCVAAAPAVSPAASPTASPSASPVPGDGAAPPPPPPPPRPPRHLLVDGACVALKVVRNHPAYFSQATMEIHYLTLLNRAAAKAAGATGGGGGGGGGGDGAQRVVALLDHFTHGGHLCLVFEFLPCTLLELLTRTGFVGLPLRSVRGIMRQLLGALHFMHSLQLCHGDIKLENVMLAADAPPPAAAAAVLAVAPPAAAAAASDEGGGGGGGGGGEVGGAAGRAAGRPATAETTIAPGSLGAASEHSSTTAVSPAAADGGASPAGSAASSSCLGFGSSPPFSQRAMTPQTGSPTSSSPSPAAGAGAGAAVPHGTTPPPPPPPPAIKLIDFGSSSYEATMSFHYVQSRFYRAPEVLLGLPYDSSIDLWSAACVAAELFLGLPLFPGCNEHDLLFRMTRLLGPLPDWMLESGHLAGRFFVTRERGTAGGGGAGDAAAADGGAPAAAAPAAAASAAPPAMLPAVTSEQPCAVVGSVDARVAHLSLHASGADAAQLQSTRRRGLSGDVSTLPRFKGAGAAAAATAASSSRAAPVAAHNPWRAGGAAPAVLSQAGSTASPRAPLPPPMPDGDGEVAIGVSSGGKGGIRRPPAVSTVAAPPSLVMGRLGRSRSDADIDFSCGVLDDAFSAGALAALQQSTGGGNASFDAHHRPQASPRGAGSDAAHRPVALHTALLSSARSAVFELQSTLTELGARRLCQTSSYRLKTCPEYLAGVTSAAASGNGGPGANAAAVAAAQNPGRQFHPASSLAALVLRHNHAQGLLQHLLESPGAPPGDDSLEAALLRQDREAISRQMAGAQQQQQQQQQPPQQPQQHHPAPGGDAASTDGGAAIPLHELHERRVFVDFLLRLLSYDPGHRMTAAQALAHPFLLAESAVAAACQGAATGAASEDMGPVAHMVAAAHEDRSIRDRRAALHAVGRHRGGGAHVGHHYHHSFTPTYGGAATSRVFTSAAGISGGGGGGSAGVASALPGTSEPASTWGVYQSPSTFRVQQQQQQQPVLVAQPGLRLGPDGFLVGGGQTPLAGAGPSSFRAHGAPQAFSFSTPHLEPLTHPRELWHAAPQAPLPALPPLELSAPALASSDYAAAMPYRVTGGAPQQQPSPRLYAPGSGETVQPAVWHVHPPLPHQQRTATHQRHGATRTRSMTVDQAGASWAVPRHLKPAGGSVEVPPRNSTYHPAPSSVAFEPPQTQHQPPYYSSRQQSARTSPWPSPRSNSSSSAAGAAPSSSLIYSSPGGVASLGTGPCSALLPSPSAAGISAHPRRDGMLPTIQLDEPTLSPVSHGSAPASGASLDSSGRRPIKSWPRAAPPLLHIGAVLAHGQALERVPSFGSHGSSRDSAYSTGELGRGSFASGSSDGEMSTSYISHSASRDRALSVSSLPGGGGSSGLQPLQHPYHSQQPQPQLLLQQAPFSQPSPRLVALPESWPLPLQQLSGRSASGSFNEGSPPSRGAAGGWSPQASSRFSSQPQPQQQQQQQQLYQLPLAPSAPLPESVPLGILGRRMMQMAQEATLLHVVTAAPHGSKVVPEGSLTPQGSKKTFSLLG